MASGQGSHWLIESPTIFSSMCSPPLSDIYLISSSFYIFHSVLVPGKSTPHDIGYFTIMWPTTLHPNIMPEQGSSVLSLYMFIPTRYHLAAPFLDILLWQTGICGNNATIYNIIIQIREKTCVHYTLVINTTNSIKTKINT